MSPQTRSSTLARLASEVVKKLTSVASATLSVGGKAHHGGSGAAASGRQSFYGLSVLLCVLPLYATIALAETESAPPVRTHAGFSVELPDGWELLFDEPDSALYATPEREGEPQQLFGYGWEEDPAAVIEEIRAEGTSIVAAGERELPGIGTFDIQQITGPEDEPGWVIQLVAHNPRGDGKTLVIQYGLMGHSEPGPGREPLERILATLVPAAEAPSEAAAPQSPPGGGAYQTPEELARALFREISALDNWDLQGIEQRYLRVIEECRATPQAEESYWRLSNLYLQAFDPPRNTDARVLLEQYLERYPDSSYLDEEFPMFANPGLPLVKERLLRIYEDLAEWPKASAIYAGWITDPATVDEARLPFLIGYAESLEKAGRTAEAITWYRTYLDHPSERPDFMISIAEEAVARLQSPTGQATEGRAIELPTPAWQENQPVASDEAVAPPGGDGAPDREEPAVGDEAPTAATYAPATTDAAPASAAAPAGTAEDSLATITGPDDATRATQLLEEARQLQLAGDYATALERYRASLALRPDPQVEERVRKLEAYLGVTAPTTPVR